MVDLIIEGCISLRAAYKRFARGLWGPDSPHITTRHEQIYVNADRAIARRCRSRQANVKAQLLSELVAAFSNESLDAYVRPTASTETFVIPADAWQAAAFPEQVFGSIEIREGHGGYWDDLLGRTPFVRRAQFDPWWRFRFNAGRIPTPRLHRPTRLS